MAEFVRIQYTGRIVDTREVFDTTDEKTAKENKIFHEGVSYGPTAIIIGEKQVMPGLEEALKDMKPGEEKTVVVPPEKGLGPRNPELVKVVPTRAFQHSNITPAPGLVVTLENNLTGRIQSVSGGRVRLDFNHELAGKTLEYHVKLVGKITGENEQVQAIFELCFPTLPTKELKIEAKTPADKKKEVEITLPKDCTKLADLQARKLRLVGMVKKLLKIERVNVLEEY